MQLHVWKDVHYIYVYPALPQNELRVLLNNKKVDLFTDSYCNVIPLDEEKDSNHLFIEVNSDQWIVRKDYRWKSTKVRDTDFQPGDILVASDNLNTKYSGYMGHSAIVVNNHEMVESPGGDISIIKAPIEKFIRHHPLYAHYRPVNRDLGERAAQYALQYYEQYEKNKQNGENKPIFSFKLSQSLDDPWEYVYCSKLVWLAYHHGADYSFKNDFLLFSPEDLFTNLKDNDDFEEIYRHEDVHFKLNT
ncbi:hypothetical protein GGQ92_001286 [Gracilibacillus halotolerans]|uniref:Permuted papain-like amidase enzyme, YaeF/YiiX, C92 family n=1 Tax=Gracilibacillus halotolerans TaxID=74386 RepID=A0A841RLK9_9BACI|nr:hypothetical protein [Gracilibacillus halotolerans]MBB6512503.1 hypothetical protein [Gracilibacillus halotolerans]